MRDVLTTILAIVLSIAVGTFVGLFFELYFDAPHWAAVAISSISALWMFKETKK